MVSTPFINSKFIFKKPDAPGFLKLFLVRPSVCTVSSVLVPEILPMYLYLIILFWRQVCETNIATISNVAVFLIVHYDRLYLEYSTVH